MRKLATVRKIAEIKAIPEADLIVAYRVDGWWVVDKKSAYAVGDLVVYVEPDAWVPHELAPFLSKGKEPSEYEGIKGERLRTVKLKKQLSQGLLLHVPGDFINVEGTDCTEALGIVKWEPKLPAQLAGDARGLFPAVVPKTEAERIQNLASTWDELRKHKFEVTEKLHGCFMKKQYIETWDSGTVTIGQIVDEGIRPKLIGVNEKGEVVPVEVTNVYNNGLKKQWLCLKFDPLEKANIVGKSGRLNCTVNHKIFKSDMTEVSASDLKTGDEVLMTSLELNDAGIHYVKSSMLGDGYIGGNGHYSFSESHATKYPKYLQYVKNIFSKVKTSSRIQTSGYGSEIEHIKVFKTNKLKKLRSEWYGSAGVKLPEDIDWIDDFSIAKWYMDDGSLAHSDTQNDRAYFATNAFSESDVERLRSKLCSLYGVAAVSYKTNKGSRIRVNYSKGTIHNMWKAIAPHIIPEQRYKLPVEYRDYPLTHYPEVIYERVKSPVKITGIEFKSLPHKSQGYVGYDLETTTHNYFCGGVLVHNSSCTFYLDLEQDFHVCSRNLDLKPSETNAYWKAALKYNVQQNMVKHGLEGLALQGEIVGEGLNGNQYKLGLEFFLFSIYDVKQGKYLDAAAREEICAMLGLQHVPVLELDVSELGVGEALVLAEGKSKINGSEREGLVLKSQHDTSVIIKIVSNRWLLKNE